MVERTFLKKCNTLFLDSEDNFGLNPIAMLNYGNGLSRIILQFDTDNFKIGGKHFLKMTNCGSIDERTFNELVLMPNDDKPKERACSFDIIAFRIPEKWDAGRGFDNSTDFWLCGKNAFSQHASNWFFAHDGKQWGIRLNDSGTTIPEEGVYSIEFLSEEFDKFLKNEDSVIFSIQHFDAGNENLNIDITKYVDGVLEKKYENFGIGLAFIPELELTITPLTQYVGFFTQNTNTFFHPVIESRYNDTILDDRYQFYFGKQNRLYFYANLGGILTDLDELPVCKVNGENFPVKHQNEGVYYAEVRMDKEMGNEEQIFYDTWSNLIYNGELLEEVEMEFVAHKKENFFNLGEFHKENTSLSPSLSGINDNEPIYQGDERTINVIFRESYSSNYELLSECFYRLYVKDGKREIDVIDWDNINTIGLSNSFKIKTRTLIPNTYYIDIKANIHGDNRIFKNKLSFRVVDNSTEMKK